MDGLKPVPFESAPNSLESAPISFESLPNSLESAPNCFESPLLVLFNPL